MAMTAPDDPSAVEVALLCNLPIGVLTWHAPEPTLTVIVKATFSLRDDGWAQLAAEQEPLTLDQPSELGEPGDLDRPSDFVPYKANADLLLAGGAYSAEPAQVIPAAFSVDNLHKRFYALAGAPSIWAPLLPAYLRASPSSESEEVRVGARAIWARAEAEDGLFTADGLPTRPLPRGFDYGVFNVAPEDQRAKILSASAQITLDGLTLGGLRRSVKLPGVRPRVFAFPPRGAARRAPPLEVVLRCDTLWIDAGLEICTLTFRGLHVPEPGAAPLLLLAMDGRDEAFSLAEAKRRLEDAVISRALTPEDLRRRPQPGASPGPILHEDTMPLSTALPELRAPLTDPGPPRFVDPVTTPLDATTAVDTVAVRRALDSILPFSEEPPPPATAPRISAFSLGGSRLAATVLSAPPEPPPPPPPSAVKPSLKSARTLPFASSTTETAPILPFTPSAMDTSSPQPYTSPALQPTSGLPFAPASTPPPFALAPPALVSPALAPQQPLMMLGPAPAASPWAPVAAAPPRPFTPPADAPPEPAREALPIAADLPPPPLLPIEAYAEVKASIWGDGLALALVLERHGIDQDVWYDNERRLARALAVEAKEGRQTLALSLREALRRARDRPPPDGDRPLGSIDSYLAIRAAVEAAPDPVALLVARGITVAEWHRMNLRIHAKAENDPALRARVGQKLGALRKSIAPPPTSPAQRSAIRRERPPAAARRVRAAKRS